MHEITVNFNTSTLVPDAFDFHWSNLTEHVKKCQKDVKSINRLKLPVRGIFINRKKENQQVEIKIFLTFGIFGENIYCGKLFSFISEQNVIVVIFNSKLFAGDK